MKRLLLWFFLPVPVSPQSTDLIIHNATVWTVDERQPLAEAIAMSSGRITAVGSNEDVLKSRTQGTRLLDVRGAFVVPGFNDNHVHFASAAQFLEFNIMAV
ncbi:MAG: hypothetical protein HYW57_02115, partial [Ignavibacteriales bacterium]|nr:hypothetical protein [Ignavibacteriales bacterium]